MYKNILFACDLSENHFDDCRKAVKIAGQLHAKLQFLHVIQTPASLQWAQSLGFAELASPVKDDAITVMKTLGEAFHLPQSHLHVEIGTPYLIILEKIKEWQVDLLILGSKSTNALPFFLGSTSHALMHHAACDILTLR